MGIGGLIAEAFGLRAVFASMGVLTALLFIPNRTLTDAALDGATGVVAEEVGAHGESPQPPDQPRPNRAAARGVPSDGSRPLG